MSLLNMFCAAVCQKADDKGGLPGVFQSRAGHSCVSPLPLSSGCAFSEA